MNLIDKIFEAGIVGCGGAGFPTHVKLNTKVEQFIINAAECEPLLRTDRYLLIHKTKMIIEAVAAIKKQLEAVCCTICLKETYTEEIECLENAIKELGADITLYKTASFYPAGDEQVMVFEVTGRVVPPAGIPLDVSCVVSNAATVYSIYNAMNEKPFVKKYLTVTGEVNSPKILSVPLGTSFKDCLEAAGRTELKNYYVICGGPMMGKPISKEEAENTFVTKTTSGFIVVDENNSLVSRYKTPAEHTLNRARAACIQCTYCTELCPRYLLGHPIKPHKVMRKLSGGVNIFQMLDDEDIRNAQYCCECGICEIYACPMSLQPRGVNVLVKKELARAGIRAEKGSGEYTPDINREYRKLPTERVAQRADVGKYYHREISEFEKLVPLRVRISLKQHIGMPSEPVVGIGEDVKMGQLIAKCPDGKLGANHHASINGTIINIDESIEIEAN